MTSEKYWIQTSREQPASSFRRWPAFFITFLWASLAIGFPCLGSNVGSVMCCDSQCRDLFLTSISVSPLGAFSMFQGSFGISWRFPMHLHSLASPVTPALLSVPQRPPASLSVPPASPGFPQRPPKSLGFLGASLSFIGVSPASSDIPRGHQRPSASPNVPRRLPASPWRPPASPSPPASLGAPTVPVRPAQSASGRDRDSQFTRSAGDTVSAVSPRRQHHWLRHPSLFRFV